MTNEEAIQKLDSIKGNYIQWMGMPDDRCEALDLAISALEKQTPKKPLNVKDSIEDLRFDWTCPSCKRQFVASSYAVNHCVDCGQKLDWSESK